MCKLPSIQSRLISNYIHYYPVHQFGVGVVNVSVWISHDNEFLVQSDTVYPKLLVRRYPFLT